MALLDIFVVRGAGDKRGEDINNPLLCTLSVALQRGQVEIDNITPSRTVQMAVKFRSGLKTGQLISVVDSLQGTSWKGKITAIDSGISGAKLTTNLTVKRIT